MFLALMMVAVSLLDLLVTTGYMIVSAVQNVNQNEMIAEAAASPLPDQEAAAAAELSVPLEENDLCRVPLSLCAQWMERSGAANQTAAF